MSADRFGSYELRVAEQRRLHPEWREGQTYFNVLYFDGFDPALADSLRGSDLDPFHRDGVVPSFLAKVREAWSAADCPPPESSQGHE